MVTGMNRRPVSTSSTRRITANLPADLLDAACATTGAGITETLTRGLDLIKQTRALDRAKRLKGKLDLNIDIEVSRERSRH